MDNIIQFNKKEDNTTKLSMPTALEITILKALTSQYGENEMVDVAHWDGECWRAQVDFIKSYAEDNNLDFWDCFAVFATKLMGTEFIFDNAGNVTVKTRGID